MISQAERVHLSVIMKKSDIQVDGKRVSSMEAEL